MSDLKQAEASLEKKADSLIKKFKTRRSWQVLGAVIFGLVTATLVFNARAANNADGLVLGTDGNNCVISQGTAVKETDQNTSKRNVNTCQLGEGSKFSPTLFRFGTSNVNNQTGNHTAAINEYKSRDKNTAESCFYLRSVNGSATINLLGLAQEDSKTENVTVTESDYQDYCIKSNISTGNQNLGLEVTSGTVKISSVLIYTTKENIIPTQPGEVFYEDFTNPESYDRFDKITWHRDRFLGPGSFQADHAPVASGNDPDNCTNPFTTRQIGPRASKSILVESGVEHVYRCAPGDDPGKAHIMTAQGSESGYDFTAFWTKDTFENVTEISWDQNITDLGGRNWSEVKIVPASKWNPVQPPCGITSVPCWTMAEGGTGGTVRTHAEMGSIGLNWFNGSPIIVTQTAEHKNRQPFRPDVNGSIYRIAEDQLQAFSSPAPRFRHTLRDNGNGTITAILDTKTTEYGEYEITTMPGSFPNEPFIVVFSTHDYTSGKSPGAYNGKTWHWDNISVK